MPMKAAPNVLLRSTSIAIVGRMEGDGGKKQWEDDQPVPFIPACFHIHRIRLPEQAFSAEREPWKLKCQGSRMMSSSENTPEPFYHNSGTRPIVQSRVSPRFGMVSVRVRGAVLEGISEWQWGPVPGKPGRRQGGRLTESDATLNFAPSPPELHPHKIKKKPVTVAVSTPEWQDIGETSVSFNFEGVGSCLLSRLNRVDEASAFSCLCGKGWGRAANPGLVGDLTHQNAITEAGYGRCMVAQDNSSAPNRTASNLAMGYQPRK